MTSLIMVVLLCLVVTRLSLFAKLLEDFLGI